MSDVKDLCLRIDKNFLKALRQPSLAAAYLLGNLYRALANKSTTIADKKRLNHSLLSLQKKLQTHHVQLLWQRIISIKPATWQLMNSDSQVSLNLLKHAILKDPFYLQALTSSMLLLLGQSINWYREVLIALIRQHCHHLLIDDPFKQGKFSYRLLRSGAAEQNFLYVSSYIAKCMSLPIDDIVQLGSQHGKIAELIMKDMTNSQGYFQVAAGFARKHAALRKNIATDWQRHLATYPLSAQDQAYLQQVLPSLKCEFPEFRKVIFDTRVSRHFEVLQSSSLVTKSTAKRHLSLVMMMPCPIALFQCIFRRINQPQTQSVFTSFARRFSYRA